MRIKYILLGLMMMRYAANAQTDVLPRERTLLAEPAFVWPTNAEQALSPGVSREEVLRLLQELFPDYPLKVYDVGEFRFVPLEKDKYYLIAVTDVSGRFMNNIEAVHCTGKTCITAQNPSDGDNDLRTQLLDVDADGLYELVTKEWAGPYDGVATLPVYRYYLKRWRNGEFIDISAEEPRAFKTWVLPLMQVDRKKAEGTLKRRLSEEGGIESSHKLSAQVGAQLQFVEDDYHRRVLGERTVGIENARRWSQSDDPNLIEIGITALEEIDSPKPSANF